jgi:hypothetical protein
MSMAEGSLLLFQGTAMVPAVWRMVLVLGWMAALGQMLVFRAVAGVSGR